MSLKVLLFSLEFPPLQGGAGKLTSYMAEGLTSLGHNVTVLAPRIDESSSSWDRKQPYRIIRLGTPFGRLLGACQSALGFHMLRRRLKPDLTLVTSAEAQSAVSLLPLSVPVDFWLVMHGTEIQQLIKDNGQGLETRLVRKVYRRMVSNARGVICVSEFTRKLLVASMPSVNGRAFVVHPGVAGPCLEPAPPADVIAFRRKLGLNGPVLLTVGRLIREKGHDVVLRALADVVPEIQSVVYLIVGKGPERPFLERLAHQLNIQRNVVFLGEVDDTLLPVVYGVADIFVMASGPGERVEGFGLVLAEAGAQGKPVIAGRTGGVPEAVRDKQNGILVDPFSPDQVRDAIFDLLRNPETARLMGENGRALVGQKFNARTMAEALLGVPGMPTSQFISEERR